jgi:hypothetical protein
MQGFGAAGMVTIKGERCPKMHRDDGTITRPCKISSWTSWELVMVGFAIGDHIVWTGLLPLALQPYVPTTRPSH